ncbi:hypothetical protein U1Q18_042477 [Sarracenia purpurea var. burkii]
MFPVEEETRSGFRNYKGDFGGEGRRNSGLAFQISVFSVGGRYEAVPLVERRRGTPVEISGFAGVVAGGFRRKGFRQGVSISDDDRQRSKEDGTISENQGISKFSHNPGDFAASGEAA